MYKDFIDKDITSLFKMGLNEEQVFKTIRKRNPVIDECFLIICIKEIKEKDEVDKMADRLLKAREINQMYGITERKQDYREFDVRSDIGNDYVVTLYPTGVMECTCDDRAPYCKHKLAVMDAMNERRV